jgi:hypothetical protein
MTETNRRLAEIELGRKITQSRASETTRLQEARRQKLAKEEAEERARSDEIYKLAGSYVAPADPPVEAEPEPEPAPPLPPPGEVEMTTRRSAKVKP